MSMDVDPAVRLIPDGCDYVLRGTVRLESGLTVSGEEDGRLMADLRNVAAPASRVVPRTPTHR